MIFAYLFLGVWHMLRHTQDFCVETALISLFSVISHAHDFPRTECAEHVEPNYGKGQHLNVLQVALAYWFLVLLSRKTIP